MQTSPDRGATPFNRVLSESQAELIAERFDLGLSTPCEAIKGVDTVIMNIPMLEDGEILFVRSGEPGKILIGTLAHFQNDRDNGLDPYEITWEQSILMLNSKDWFGTKYKLEHLPPLDDDIPIILDSDWLEEIND